MAMFEYQAMSKTGQMTKGTIEGTDRSSIIATLSKQGLRPLSVKAQANKSKAKGIGFLKPKVKTTDIVLFTRQLSTMVSAGVPLLRALNTLQTQVENPSMKAVLEDLIKEVQGGSQLADALAKHPEVFSDIFVNMIRAGEAAGIVDDILKRLATQVEKNASMKKKIKSASTYPMVLLTLTVVAFFGLMIFVIPTIGRILKDLGGPNAQLPATTQAMLQVSDFMVSYWYILIGVLVAIIFGLRKYLATDAGKLNSHRLALKVPVLKTLIMKISVARFTRTFASLVGAGVSVVEALRVTAKAIGNKVYENEVTEAAKLVVNGKQLSQAIEGSKLFPGIVPQMLAVGEETGQTDTVLIKVADFYEEEVDATIDSLSSILEPVMIVIMGGAVGFIAVNVMGPIASLSQNIQ